MYHEYRIAAMALLNVQSRVQDWDSARVKDVYILVIRVNWSKTYV